MREVSRLVGEASGGCLGFEGSRPRRPFRLSVRTTAEEREVLRKEVKAPGDCLQATLHTLLQTTAPYKTLPAHLRRREGDSFLSR